MRLVLLVVPWLCFAPACLEFGAKENIIDISGMISSEDGYITGQFMPDHDPPISGKNALEFILADDDGRPIVDAEVTVTPFMPSMGHGSTEDPIVEEKGDGEYLATNIVYTMKGEWTLTIDVETDSVEDSFVLFYVVESTIMRKYYKTKIGSWIAGFSISILPLLTVVDDAWSQACCASTGSSDFSVVGRKDIAAVAAMVQYEPILGRYNRDGEYIPVDRSVVRDVVFTAGFGIRPLPALRRWQIFSSLTRLRIPVTVVRTSSGVGRSSATPLTSDLCEMS